MILAENTIVRVIRRYKLPPEQNMYLVHDRTGEYALQLPLTPEVTKQLDVNVGARIIGYAYANIMTDPETQELIIELKGPAPDQGW